MPSYQPVEAVVRAFHVLETISALGEAGAREIEAATSINRATVIRMIETLEHLGYVQRKANGAYSVARRVLVFRTAFNMHDKISEMSLPALARLQERVGWPCDVAMCDGIEMLVLAAELPQRKMSYSRPAGLHGVQILGSSLGLSYLAFASEEERTRILNAHILMQEPWNEPARQPSMAAELFELVRSRGFAMMNEDYSAMRHSNLLNSIAVPVLVKGVAVASIGAVFLKAVLTPQQAIDSLLEPLQETAQMVSAGLGAEALVLGPA